MQKNDGFDSVSSVMNLINEFLTVFENAENSIYEEMTCHIKESGFNASGNLPSSLSECHILHHIGLGEHGGGNKAVNGKKLAEMMCMTKGGISKLTAKLQAKGLIQARRAPDNRREVNYSLTENGWEIFRLHAKLHEVMYANVSRLIQKYDRNERLLISDFLEKIIDITQAVPKISELP